MARHGWCYELTEILQSALARRAAAERLQKQREIEQDVASVYRGISEDLEARPIVFKKKEPHRP
jgi:hypothetical protein